MKIPRTTPTKPYIEFKIYRNGRIKLKATNSWWGGIDAVFASNDGSFGNSCPPNDLKEYLAAFYKRRESDYEKEIALLIKEVKSLKGKINKLNNENLS